MPSQNLSGKKYTRLMEFQKRFISLFFFFLVPGFLTSVSLPDPMTYESTQIHENRSIASIEQGLHSCIDALRELVTEFKGWGKIENYLKTEIDKKDQYRYLAPIGEGGQSHVHLLKRNSDAKLFALKLPHSKEMVIEKIFQRRLQAYEEEAKILSLNISPAFPKLEEFSLSPLYLIIENIQGKPLDLFLKGKSKLSHLEFLELLLDIHKQLLSALDSLHTSGWLHLDLKPSNLLIEKDGRVRIIDFGFSKKIGTELHAIGTSPDFTAPELTLFSRASESSLPLWPTADIYSLGAIMKGAISNHFGPDAERIQKSLPKLHKRLDLFYNQLLNYTNPNPLDRYQSAQAALKDFESIYQ